MDNVLRLRIRANEWKNASLVGRALRVASDRPVSPSDRAATSRKAGEDKGTINPSKTAVCNHGALRARKSSGRSSNDEDTCASILSKIGAARFKDVRRRTRGRCLMRRRPITLIWDK